MKKILLILLYSSFYNICNAQCSAPTTPYSSNINYYNADANWDNQSNVYNYKIRYRILGSSSWLYKNNIDSLATTKNINNLQPLNTYIWQIRSYCDSAGLNYSQWSITDTFYTSTIHCPTISGIYTTNINYNSATANWSQTTGVNRYKVQFRILGTTNWLNLAFIDSLQTNVLIPLLQPNTTYEWEIMAYYDSSFMMASLWSNSDTFSTTTFIYSAFNPIITNTIDNTICNNASNLTLFASQSLNEPDIGTSTITSDGGSFNIQSLSIGDSVGYAIMNTSTQTISAILKAGYIAGQNYAIINSYDSTGSIIGFFSIENVNGGIKITSTSPNDGNNYTSGFTSEVNFNNLFINPNINGPLNFYTDINSELNDQFNDTTTVIINCIIPVTYDCDGQGNCTDPGNGNGNYNSIISCQAACAATSIAENRTDNNISFEIYDLLGKKTKFKENSILIYKYSNGEIRKIITQIK